MSEHEHHEHGHGHEHEHLHEHGHEHHDHGNAPKHGVSISEMEGAVIASLSFEDYVEATAHQSVCDKVAEKLSDIARWVREQGGAVGHIKSIITQGGTITTLSTTGSAVQAREQADLRCQIDLAVIVFGIEPEVLRLKLEQTFAETK